MKFTSKWFPENPLSHVPKLQNLEKVSGISPESPPVFLEIVSGICLYGLNHLLLSVKTVHFLPYRPSILDPKAGIIFRIKVMSEIFRLRLTGVNISETRPGNVVSSRSD